MPDSSHVFKIFEKHSRKSVLLENEPLFLKNSLNPLLIETLEIWVVFAILKQIFVQEAYL